MFHPRGPCVVVDHLTLAVIMDFQHGRLVSGCWIATRGAPRCGVALLSLTVSFETSYLPKIRFFELTLLSVFLLSLLLVL